MKRIKFYNVLISETKFRVVLNLKVVDVFVFLLEDTSFFKYFVH